MGEDHSGGGDNDDDDHSSSSHSSYSADLETSGTSLLGGGSASVSVSASASASESASASVSLESSKGELDSGSNSGSFITTAEDRDGSSDGELIDGIVFPSSLPKGLLNDSFASLSGHSSMKSDRSGSNSNSKSKSKSKSNSNSNSNSHSKSNGKSKDVAKTTTTKAAVGAVASSTSFVKRMRNIRGVNYKRADKDRGAAKSALAQAILDAETGDGHGHGESKVSASDTTKPKATKTKLLKKVVEKGKEDEDGDNDNVDGEKDQARDEKVEDNNRKDNEKDSSASASAAVSVSISASGNDDDKPEDESNEPQSGLENEESSERLEPSSSSTSSGRGELLSTTDEAATSEESSSSKAEGEDSTVEVPAADDDDDADDDADDEILRDSAGDSSAVELSKTGEVKMDSVVEDNKIEEKTLPSNQELSERLEMVEDSVESIVEPKNETGTTEEVESKNEEESLVEPTTSESDEMVEVKNEEDETKLEHTSAHKISLKQRMEMYLAGGQNEDDDDNDAKETKQLPDMGTEMISLAQRMETYLSSHMADADDDDDDASLGDDLGIDNIPLTERLGNYLEAGWSSCSSLTYEPVTTTKTKRLDLKTQRRVMTGAAAKIQRLVRRYLSRKRQSEKDAAMNVVSWLRSHKGVSVEDSGEITDADGSDVVGMVEALEAAIENLDDDIGEEIKDDDTPVESQNTDSSPLGPISEAERGSSENGEEVDEDSTAWIKKYDIVTLDDLGRKELSEQAKERMVAKRKLQQESVTKIQALMRGFKVRSIDHERIEMAVQWLKSFKEAAKENSEIDVDMTVEEIDNLTSMPTTAARVVLKSVQDKLDASAIKIQALSRGVASRQFDHIAHARASALIASKLENNEIVCIDGDLFGEPDEKALDRAWTFLDETNKSRELQEESSAVEKPVSTNDQEQVREFVTRMSKKHVNSLVDTWEWLADRELEGLPPSYSSSNSTSGLPVGPKAVPQPHEEEILRLKEFVKTNRESSLVLVNNTDSQESRKSDTRPDINVSQSVELWNWLASHGMNMNVFRNEGNEVIDENAENRDDCEVDSKDPSHGLLTKPSMESMVTYWDFSSQYSSQISSVDDSKLDESGDEAASLPTSDIDKKEDDTKTPESDDVDNTESATSEEKDETKSLKRDAPQQKPNIDKFFGTLAWLRSQGLNLAAVGTAEKISVDDSSTSDQNDSPVEKVDSAAHSEQVENSKDAEEDTASQNISRGDSKPSTDCQVLAKATTDEELNVEDKSESDDEINLSSDGTDKGKMDDKQLKSASKSRRSRDQQSKKTRTGAIAEEVPESSDSDSSSDASQVEKSKSRKKSKRRSGRESKKPTIDDTEDAGESSDTDVSSSSSESDDSSDDESDAGNETSKKSKKAKKKASPAMQWLLQKGIKAKAPKTTSLSTDDTANDGKKPRKKYTFTPFVPSKDAVMAMAQRKLADSRKKEAKPAPAIMSGRDLQAKFDADKSKQSTKRRPVKKPLANKPSRQPSKQDMENALHFLQQKKGAAASKQPKVVEEKEQPAPPVPHKSPTKTGKEKLQPMDKETEDALRWLSGQTMDDPKNAPYFEKINSMLPKKASQTNEQRAKELVKALKWVKKQNEAKSSGKDTSQPQTIKGKSDRPPSPSKPHAQSPEKSTPPENEDVTNCLAWLSNRDGGHGIKDAVYFKKIDSMLPKKSGQSDIDRARDMVKALKWVKKKSAQKKGVVTPSTSVPVTATPSTLSQQQPSTDGGKDSGEGWWGNGTSKAEQKEEDAQSDWNSSDDEPDIGKAARSKRPSRARSKSPRTKARSKSPGTKARSKSPGTKARSKSPGTKARSKSPGTKKAKKSLKAQDLEEQRSRSKSPAGLQKQKSKSKLGGKSKTSKKKKSSKFDGDASSTSIELSQSSILDESLIEEEDHSRSRSKSPRGLKKQKSKSKLGGKSKTSKKKKSSKFDGDASSTSIELSQSSILDESLIEEEDHSRSRSKSPRGLKKQKSKSKLGGKSKTSKKKKSSQFDAEASNASMELSQSSLFEDGTSPHTPKKKKKKKNSQDSMNMSMQMSSSSISKRKKKKKKSSQDGMNMSMNMSSSSLSKRKKKKRSTSLDSEHEPFEDAEEHIKPTSTSAKKKKKSKSLDKKASSSSSSSADGEQTKTKKKEKAPEPPKPTGDADLDGILGFLHAKQSGGNPRDTTEGAQWKRLDNMMPTKAGQSMEDRAKDMKRMMAWLKKKGQAK